MINFHVYLFCSLQYSTLLLFSEMVLICLAFSACLRNLRPSVWFAATKLAGNITEFNHATDVEDFSRGVSEGGWQSEYSN